MKDVERYKAPEIGRAAIVRASLPDRVPAGRELGMEGSWEEISHWLLRSRRPDPSPTWNFLASVFLTCTILPKNINMGVGGRKVDSARVDPRSKSILCSPSRTLKATTNAQVA